MDKETRNAIDGMTQRARRLLEADFAEQLEGIYDVMQSGTVAQTGGAHLSPRQRQDRETIVAAVGHKQSQGMTAAEAVRDYVRDAAFTTLHRFVALKMLEVRELVQECVSRGDTSSGYQEFCGLAPGVRALQEEAGYRLYIESIFDELSTEVKVLFDRNDPAAVLWPRRQTFHDLLAVMNLPEMAAVWGEDETIGWVYQYFNSEEERRLMRKAAAPRNSRELAVRNQFFTPRYVVRFLTDNTLGRVWYEMRQGKTRLIKICEYMVREADGKFQGRPLKDPRDISVLDPACGSGHFLLYAFDLLAVIYEEAWQAGDTPRSEATDRTLHDDYPDIVALRMAVPALILRHNLHGVDIDPRCAQIAQLALWMRAQRAFQEMAVPREQRPVIRRANIVIAEPVPRDDELYREFTENLSDQMLREYFRRVVVALEAAGEMGLLIRLERTVEERVRQEGYDMFAPPREALRSALARFIAEADLKGHARRGMFAEDAAQGLGLVELAGKKYDVVLMNPPFGAGSAAVKDVFEEAYPLTKNNIFAAFVERGIELLGPRGRLGAITSRTGFFLSSFKRWREDILLAKAPPVVVADLGGGVLDSAMVETAAYCLEVAP
jgi:hypothetical protein